MSRIFDGRSLVHVLSATRLWASMLGLGLVRRAEDELERVLIKARTARARSARRCAS